MQFGKKFRTLFASMMAMAGLPMQVFSPTSSYRGPTASRSRGRIPNSNAGERRDRSIPHGTSGAKLARAALKRRVGLATLR